MGSGEFCLQCGQASIVCGHVTTPDLDWKSRALAAEAERDALKTEVEALRPKPKTFHEMDHPSFAGYFK